MALKTVVNRRHRVAPLLALLLLLPLAACDAVPAAAPERDAALDALTPESADASAASPADEGAIASSAAEGGEGEAKSVGEAGSDRGEPADMGGSPAEEDAPAAHGGGGAEMGAGQEEGAGSVAPVPSSPDAITTPAPPGGGGALGGDADLILTQVAAMGLGPEAAAPMLTVAAEEAMAVGGGTGALGAAEGAEAFRATQEALEQENNIAQVDDLVQSVAPLATFTPAALPPELDGRLLYLRNGRFFVKDADGSDGQRLEPENEDMPSVWSPPDDPGRAWVAPDRAKVGFLAGVDAQVWVMDIDGGDNRQISDNVLPDEKHAVAMGEATRDVKLMPGSDYTLVYTPGGENEVSVLVDSNDYAIGGQARLRFVHAIRNLANNVVYIHVDGQQVGGMTRYGRATAEEAFPVGAVALEVKGNNDSSFGVFPGLAAENKEVKTYFVWGDRQDTQVTEVAYEPGTRPASGHSRVRFFNAGAAAVDPTIDGRSLPTGSLAPGEISPYIEVEGTLSQDVREDFEISIYGLRPGEDPITWAPSSDRFAFLAGPTGIIDLYVAELDGTVTRLTQDELRETNPAWAPHGRSLAWVAVDESFGGVQVFALPELGGAARAIDMSPVRTALGADAAAKVAIPEGIAWADDDTLFFYPKVGKDSAGIWAYEASTGALRQVWSEPVDDPTYSQEARAWAFHDQDTGAISVLGLDGSAEVVVASNGYFPDWSPDGETLTYGEGDPTSSEGWRLRAIDADGGNDRALTERLPLLQESPPVPGPNVKRFWIDDETLVFSRVGRDYGKKDRAGVVGQVEAGNDIENLYGVKIDGRSAPVQYTDLMKVFYMRDVTPSRDGEELAFIAFAYNSAGQQLFTAPAEGGKPVKIDGPVRWFAWVD